MAPPPGRGGVATLGAVGGELFLRWFPEHLPAEARFRLDGEIGRVDGLKSRPHEYVGYLWPPHARDSFEGIHHRFSYTTDAHGFRNPGPWPERADVVVLGDSQAFGYGVEDHQVWVELVERNLPGQEVVNLGLIGAAPQQFLRIYELYGAALRPQVVLVALFPPNALYAGRLFEDWLAEGRLDRFDARRSGSAPREGGVWSEIKSYARHSYLVRGLYYSGKALFMDPSPREIAFEDGGRIQLLPKLFSAPEPVDYDLVVDVVLRLQHVVEGTGAEMLVTLSPTKEEVYWPLLGDEQGAAWVNWLEPFVAAFERRGIRYLDLTPILQERAARGERLFFEIDVHPNVEGYRLIADAVAEHLAKLSAPDAASD